MKNNKNQSSKFYPFIKTRLDEVAQSPYRPKYHIAPPHGLTNDPNGLCYFNGKYHVFYQWNPFEVKHNIKYWNHVSSEDMVQWEQEEEVLIPDEEYEKNGCYSGNAYVDSKENKAYLYYTANYKDDNGNKIPKQALATLDSNGQITKSVNNPIITDQPDGIGGNIRDPFVFEYKNKLLMLIGAETIDGKGALLVYEALDYENWDYLGQVQVNLDGKKLELGSMVECPALIQIDNKDILFLSLIGAKIEGISQENRFDSIYLVGEFDLKNLQFNAKSLNQLDYGFDFYAPQPFFGKNNEPLYLAWFGCANQVMPEDIYSWRHALTLPRQLILENDVLRTPVIESIKNRFKKVHIVDSNPDFFESTNEPILIEWDLKDDYQKHQLNVGLKDDYWSLTVDFKNNTLTVDRTNLKIPVDQDYGFKRTLKFKKCKNLKLEIFLDNSFNEVYVNDGENVLSFRSYEDSLIKK